MAEGATTKRAADGAMMALVVDASIAVKWLVREHDTEQARDLLRNSEPLIAPDWLLVEAASTLWKKVKRSELLDVDAARHLADMPQFFARLFPAADLVAAAFDWSMRLRHPVYDCVYLALAKQQDCMLVTADERFANVAHAAGLADCVALMPKPQGA